MVTRQQRKNEMTRDEFRAFLESRVQKQLNMNLTEFMRRRQANDLPDVPGCAELDVLAGERAHQDTRSR